MIDKEIRMDDTFLLETLQGGIVYSDFEPPFRLQYCTEGMAELSGYTIAELMNMYQMDLVYEPDIQSLAEEVEKQLSVGDTFSVEYRLKRKDGKLVYVLDKAKAVLHENGKKYVHCMLTDISNLKNMEQALWLSQEKYKIALKQSGNVILEFDVKTRNLVFSENYNNVFSAEAPVGNIIDIANSNWVEPTYKDVFVQLFDKAIQNKTTHAMELKLRQATGEYVWGKLHLTPVINTRGETYCIVGCLKNIDKEKQHISFLTERSEKDGLTGIYNRVYMEEKVNAFVQSHKNKGALFIIDIDNFKNINDTKGHAFGDEVLIRIVEVIKNALPNDAIFGRLGGDEFLVFVNNFTSKEQLGQLAQNIINSVALAGKGKEFLEPTTVSIGAASATENINGFSGLYKNADKALYNTKINGRNGFSIE